MTSPSQVALGLAALFAALLGALWCGFQVWGTALAYSAGAGGSEVSPQHISRTVFIAPGLALAFVAGAFIARSAATSYRASLWLLVPPVGLAIFTILVALTAL